MQTGSDNDLDDEARWGSDGVLINGNPTSGSPCEFLWHSIVFSKYIHSRFHIHKEQWRGQQPFPSMDGKVASSWGHSTMLKCQQILNVTGPAGHFPLKTSLPCFGTTVHTHKIQGTFDDSSQQAKIWPVCKRCWSLGKPIPFSMREFMWMAKFYWNYTWYLVDRVCWQADENWAAGEEGSFHILLWVRWNGIKIEQKM